MKYKTLVKKFLHSCLLLEKDGSRILIDPGVFCFIEGKIKPEDIGSVDAIFITHKHADHFDIPSLRTLMSLGAPEIYTIEEIGHELVSAGMTYHKVEHGTSLQIVGFDVQVFSAPHGALPISVPHNVGFLIDALFHPGDSFDPQGLEHCETLALPIAGPWVDLPRAMAFVDRLKPKNVIPIHDAIIKDFMLERMYELMLKPVLEKKEIKFCPLHLDQVFDQ